MTSELEDTTLDESNSDSDVFKIKKAKIVVNEAASVGECVPSSKYSCPSCHKVLASLPSLSRHKKGCKKGPSKTDFSCCKCHKEFVHSSSLYRHQVGCSGPRKVKVVPQENTYICSKCEVQTCGRSSFMRHAKICKGKDSTKYTKCFEASCSVYFHKRIDSIQHLITEHLQEINIDELTFNSKEEFLEFKRVEDEKHFMSCVKHTGTLSTKNNAYSYYVCNFDARDRNNSVLKIPGCKCPARMLVKEELTTGKCFVRYIRHHNHKLEVRNLQFHQYTPELRDYISSLLEMGVSPRKIRENLAPPGVEEEFPRKEHFISIKEIRDMHYRLLKRSKIHVDDAEAVRILASRLQAENSLLWYKPQNTEQSVFGPDVSHLPDASSIFAFAFQTEKMRNEMIAGARSVLCADGTHNTNKYRFYLLNIVVPDEYTNGYPVAHLIANTLDHEILTLFFDTLKQRSPELYVNALMTDDDKALWTGFSSVFGIVRHLLCIWHIHRAWQRQLQALVKNRDLVSELYERLVLLMKEPDPDHFSTLLACFLDEFSENIESQAFIDYFKKFYCGRTEKWAFCFRNFDHGDTDTNMYCESLHSYLKRLYLKDKVNTSLQELILILLQLGLDKFRDLRKKRIMHELPPGLKVSKDWKSSHNKGMQFEASQVSVASEKEWIVESQTRKNIFHKVVSVSQICYISDCWIKCKKTECQNLCMHMYSCSCENTNPLCKHIHKVHSIRVKDKVPAQGPDEDPGLPVEEELNLHCLPPSNLPEFDHDRGARMFEEVQNLLTDLLEDIKIPAVQKTCLPHFRGVLSQLKKVANSVANESVQLPPVPFMKHVKTHPNEKKKKQPGLFQTRKKRVVQKTSTFSHPSKERLFDLKKELLGLDPSLKPDDLPTFINDTCEDVSRPRFTIKGVKISLLHLKSLLLDLDSKEVHRLELSTKNEFQLGWLYDNVIDAFLFILTEPYVDAMNIRCWISSLLSAPHINIFESLPEYVNFNGKSTIFIPCNPISTHWILLICSVERRVLYFINPKFPNQDLNSDILYGTLVSRWKSAFEFFFPGNPWLVKGLSHCRQSMDDSVNCGVYVSCFVEKILKNENLEDELDVVAYRRMMLRAIAKEGLKNVIVYPSQ